MSRGLSSGGDWVFRVEEGEAEGLGVMGCGWGELVGRWWGLECVWRLTVADGA